MNPATVLSRAQFGLDAPLVRVEVHCGGGLPQFGIVGLPEVAVRESRERVRAAIVKDGAEFPPGRITVNLAPADLPKTGGRFDLPIALGILAAAGRLPYEPLRGVEFFGELSLSGELQGIRGALAASLHAAREGHRIVVPPADVDEARAAPGAQVAGAGSLDMLRHAIQDGTLAFEAGAALPHCETSGPDLSDVRGQLGPRRALEIAAAGGHSVLLVGPPGAGKSMLAQRLPGILPALADDEAIEAAMLQSLVRKLPAVSEWRRPPFRAPHHGASAAAVIGGGGRLRPGEVSLAHRGVLFLDELPEFRRDVLEALREPLETGFVSVARAAWRGQFPAGFQLVAAMNPCPCGYAGDPGGRCRCTRPMIRQYLGKLSGPLLDRIDLHVEVPRQQYSALRTSGPSGESTAAVAERVAGARERQRRRGLLNSMLEPGALGTTCRLGAREHGLLETATRRLGLSARACHRIQRVARTIADLGGADRVGVGELSEAIGYRRLDREPQGATG